MIDVYSPFYIILKDRLYTNSHDISYYFFLPFCTVRVEAILVNAVKMYRGIGIQLHLFLSSVLVEVNDLFCAWTALPLGRIPPVPTK